MSSETLADLKMGLSRKFVNYVLLVLMLGLVSELFSCVAGHFLAKKGILYKAPVVDGYAGYLSKRDKILGWPEPGSFGGNLRDASGSRITPSFPDPSSGSCVSAYGDSFTWGFEVSDEFAWGNQLSKMLDCRVSNFGVGGYGTDQAYLRFRGSRGDTAKIVILGHMSENIVRNVTQFFYLLYAHDPMGLKPRYVIDGNGALQLIPLPSLTKSEYRRMLEDPKNILCCDYLVPGGPTGTQKAGFPHSLALLKTVGNYRVKAKLTAKPFWADFYRRDHPSDALRLTASILRAFNGEALSRGRIPLVVIFPAKDDILYYRRHMKWVYRNLIEELKAGGVKVFDMGPPMIEALGRRDPSELFTPRGYHYNEEGNRVVAAAIRAFLPRLEHGAGRPLGAERVYHLRSF